MKRVRYIAEAAALYLLFLFFRLLPVGPASACGGWLGRTVGPRLAASRKAYRNLQLALPEKGEAERRAIVTGMWDNLGRIMGEYPHLKAIARSRVEVINGDILTRIKKNGQPAILFSGHIANWEVPQQYLAAHVNPIAAIYREPNNPWTRRLLSRARDERDDLVMIPKSRTSTRHILNALNEKRFIGVLIDQKYNEGIPVPFFGRPAMTSTAFVQLAEKFKCPLVPGLIERLDGARFRMTFYEPLAIFDTEGNPRPVEDVLAEINRMLEGWIRERPEQWLWLHRRWPES